MPPAKNKITGLTHNQEKFAQLIALEKKNQSDAYRIAYPSSLKWLNKSIWEKASALAADSKVSSRIKELKGEITEKTIKELVYTRTESFKVFDDNIVGLKKTLADVLENEDMTISAKVAMEVKLRQEIRNNEEQKAKLYSLYVEKKDISFDFGRTLESLANIEVKSLNRDMKPLN